MRPEIRSSQLSSRQRNVRSGWDARPGVAAVEPLSTRTYQGSASVNSHWIVAPWAAEVSSWRLIPSNSSLVASELGLTCSCGAPR